jgi:hypothetical protein
MSQKDLKDQSDNLDEQLHDDEKLDIVEVSEDTVDEATLAAKGDAKSAKFGQGSDFEDDKPKKLATTSQQPVPKTKSGIISAAVDKLSGMKKEDLDVIYTHLFDEGVDLVELSKKTLGSYVKKSANSAASHAYDTGHIHGYDDDDDSPETEKEVDHHQNKMAKRTTGIKRAVSRLTKEDFASEEQIKEDLKVLIDSDSNLSEEFKDKASTLFEAALSSRLFEEKAKLQEKYVSELSEEVEGIRSELVEKIDGYLNYVVEQWMTENELAIDTGLRSEIAESFMTQLQQVFAEHYIEVPESKIDLVDSLAEQVEELETKLQESTEKTVKLAEELEVLQRAEIISEAASDLATTEADKLMSLVEGVDYDDAESFAKKVQIIKEAHFKKSAVGSTQEEITEDTQEQTQSVSPRMAAYVSAISRTLK